MKTLLSVLFIFVFIPATVNSQTNTWIEQTSGTTQTLTSVHSSYSINVWACGYAGTVLRSTNHGTTWLNVSGNGIPANVLLINIVSIEPSTAIVAGYIGANTFVYRTSNNGANWSQVFTETNGFINAMVVNSGSVSEVLMMGDPVGGRWSLWRTTNAGLNWDSTGMYLQQIGAEAGWNNSMSTNNSFGSNVWFGTNNSKIYYSSNFGSSWIAKPVSELNTYSVWLSFNNDGQGLTGGTNLLKTTNNGTNWNSIVTLGAGNFGGITGGPFIITNNSFLPPLYYVRSDNKIYKSINEGTSWTAQYTAPTGIYRYIASNVGNATELWAVRDNGGISHAVLVSGINQISSEIPDRFSLSQNYPNPFNPTTHLEFACPPARQGISHLEFVSLKVYDISGKEIADLVNEKKSAGTYSVEFDGSDFTSGIYFYTLTAGDYRETKKMMLIK